MARRIRSIKPEWLIDERLVLASDPARVLTIAMLLMADDYGNGRANRVVLAAHVFPGAPVEKLDAALREVVEDLKFAEVYEVDGQTYYHVRNWEKHQKVDHPGKPQVPGPPGAPKKRRKSSRKSRESVAKDSESIAEEAEDLAPRAIPSSPFLSLPDPKGGAGGGDAPSVDHEARTVARPREPGSPPKPRHDPLAEQIRFVDWSPSTEHLPWWREIGLSDRGQDSALAALRDHHGRDRRSVGRWDELVEKYSLQQLEIEKPKPRGSKTNKRGRPEDHGRTGWE